MTRDTQLHQLVINKLTTEQYNAAVEAGTIDDTQLYMTTDSPNVTDVTVNGTTVTNNGVANIVLGSMATENKNNYPLDANVVHKTGAETIGGDKTFSNNIIMNNSIFYIKNSENGNTSIRPGSIELLSLTTATHGGYIDFHYAGDTSDYTSRIIEGSSGVININGSNFSRTVPATVYLAPTETTTTSKQIDTVGARVTACNTKVDKVSTASRVYGTDSSGNQTTYDYNAIGKVDDVKVGTTSVVNNKIATLGTMASETASNYSTKAVADTLYAEKSLETTVANKVDKVSTASKVYGTNSSGSQTTYNVSDLSNKVTDVKVGNTSVVSSKVATLGTMAGETATNYYKKTDLGTMALENTTNYYKKTDLATIATTGSWSNLSGTPTTISGYGITDAYTKTEVDGKLSGAMHFKGTKATVSALPSSGNVTGDMWNVTETGANYAWDGSAWDKLSENIDLSGFYTKTESDNRFVNVAGDTMTGNLTLTNGAAPYIKGNTNFTTATASAAHTVLYARDSNNTPIGQIYNYLSYSATEGKSSTGWWIRSYNRNDSSKYADIRNMVSDEGVAELLYAPNNATNYNVTAVTNSTTNNHLATMGWVNNPETSTNVVHRSGDETIAGTKTFSSPIDGTISTTVAAGSTKELLRASVAANDYFRLMVGGASNAGYVELATADDGNEPIYVRQYSGNFATLKRTATLLDGSGNTTFPGTVNANRVTANVLDGSLVSYQSHNGETGNLYRKLGEVILTGTYQSVVVPFFYYKDAVNTSEVGYQGKISLRVHSTAGVIDTGNTGVVLSEYPDWINNGNVIFYVLYKNNTPEENQATCEIWSYVKNAWDGFKIVPMNYHGYGRNSWTWYDNIAGVESLPEGYSQISQKYGIMYTTTPNEDTTSSHQVDTVGARNTKLSSYALNANVVHITGNETIGGTKTFTSGVIRKTTSLGSDGPFTHQSTVLTKGTSPSTSQESRWYLTDKNGSFGNAYSIGGIDVLYNTTGKISTHLRAFKPEANSSSSAEIAVYYPSSGSAYTYAPTPTDTTTTSGTQIATTGWVNTRKQDKLTAGTNITISNNVISADFENYSKRVVESFTATANQTDFVVTNYIPGKDYLSVNVSNVELTSSAYSVTGNGYTVHLTEGVPAGSKVDIKYLTDVALSDSGATFTPTVSKSNYTTTLSWTNDRGLNNPTTVKIYDGVIYTPAQTKSGNAVTLSWTNNQGKTNPSSVVLYDGATFTPSETISQDGNYMTLSWTNDRSLPNPQDVTLYLGQDNTTQRYVDTFTATANQTTFVATHDILGRNVLSVNIDNTELTSSTYTIGQDKRTVTLSDPVEAGAVVELKYFHNLIMAEDGATYTPAVTSTTGGYNLSWTNDKGLQNPSTVFINSVYAVGAYSASSTYKAGNLVTYEDSNYNYGYIAKKAVPAGTSLSNTTYWTQAYAVSKTYIAATVVDWGE